MSSAAPAKRRLLPEVEASSFTPSGVRSNFHAITTAIGNPRRETRIKTRKTHGGASKAGKPIDAACTTSHATTR
ncbi:MAG: hypothetical protein DLM73_01085 [Chthoniobacterales bacterium]|nr:MAG: hypothetical protein DLM73_01085 [Chthoniobacterales bacterium]